MCDWIDSPIYARNKHRISRHLSATWIDKPSELTRRLASGLNEYFEGNRVDFDLPIRLAGTPFQIAVWEALLTIPFGRLVTYGEVAAAIGRPSAVRAVATAIGANPLSIIVPCHRVVGSGAALTGYSGGIPAKSRLLSLEGVTLL